MAHLNRMRLEAIHKSLNQDDPLLLGFDEATDQLPQLSTLQLFQDDLLRRRGAADLKAVACSLTGDLRALDIDHSRYHAGAQIRDQGAHTGKLGEMIGR